MNQEREAEIYHRVIADLMVIMKVEEEEMGEEVRDNYDEAIKYFDSRVSFMNQKMDALVENKELMVRDKMVYE